LYYPHAWAVHLTHQSVNRTGGRQVDFYVSEVYYYRKYYGCIAAFLIKALIIVFSFCRIAVSFFKPRRKDTRVLLIQLIKKMLVAK
jgi:hypothetical protein